MAIDSETESSRRVFMDGLLGCAFIPYVGRTLRSAAVSKRDVGRPRSSTLAAMVSAALHAAGIAALWFLHAAPAGARMFDTELPATERRWNRISADGTAGINASRITQVLQAADAVRVMLTPASAQASGQGLAWWSPTRGIWIAVEDLPALPRDHAYQLWLVRRDGPAVYVGWLGVSDEGAGRMLAIARDGAPPIEGPVMI